MVKQSAFLLKNKWYLIKEISIDKYCEAIKPLFINDDNNYEILKKQEDKFIKEMMMSLDDIDEKEWDRREIARRKQKIYEMKIGLFHQKIMGAIDGYIDVGQNHETGCDIISVDNSLVLEIKNKENTMNADCKKIVFNKLKKCKEKYKEAMLVYINAWTFKKSRIIDTITILSGEEAYTKLSGRTTFYEHLIKTLTYTFKKYKSYDDFYNSIKKFI